MSWEEWAWLMCPSPPPQIRGSRSRALPDRALVNCQYSSATFSTGERKRRPHGDRKSCEMGLQLRQAFEAAILTQLHPRSQIDIYVQVSRQQPSAAEGREKEGVGVGHQQPNGLTPLGGGVTAGAAGRWWDLCGLCERGHAGSAGRRDTHAGLCMCLLSWLCGWDSPGRPQPCGGSSWWPPAGPGPAASLRPDRTAGDGCKAS
uniref:Exosome complex component RRP41-like n=1 Tax=Sus scrofa TaxID=9823 RepID=A0A480ZTP8_PIG